MSGAASGQSSFSRRFLVRSRSQMRAGTPTSPRPCSRSRHLRPGYAAAAQASTLAAYRQRMGWASVCLGREHREGVRTWGGVGA
eukprot:365642-Chlamydomonas_euryale.AAC.3